MKKFFGGRPQKKYEGRAIKCTTFASEVTFEREGMGRTKNYQLKECSLAVILSPHLSKSPDPNPFKIGLTFEQLKLRTEF